MLDRVVFEAEILRLETRFNHPLHDTVRAEYYEFLSQDFGLETQEFQHACHIIRRDHRFFPTAKDIADAVRPTGDELALLEWQAIAEFLKLPADQRYKLGISEEGLAAYRGMGGAKALDGNASNQRMAADFAALRRAFAKHNQAANRAALPYLETRINGTVNRIPLLPEPADRPPETPILPPGQ